MIKSELTKKIVNKLEGFNQKDIDAVLIAMGEVVIEAMESEDKVALPGLGVFSVKDVPERRGTIHLGDRKGEEYVTPAHKEPKFKAVKAFKDCLL